MSELPKLTSDAAGRFPVVGFNIHAKEPIAAIAQLRDHHDTSEPPQRVDRVCGFSEVSCGLLADMP